jgi:hypothetical protein
MFHQNIKYCNTIENLGAIENWFSSKKIGIQSNISI